MSQIKLNIWQLFILISVIFFTTNIQAKPKYTLVKGKDVEVCELYLQNLLKLDSPPQYYPHKIHPDLSGQLIHSSTKNWQRLDQQDYKLLYVRFHSFLRYGYQYYSDLGEKESVRIWPANDLYAFDLDTNNDGQTETIVGHKVNLFRHLFVVANLGEQSIDETLSYHLLWPKALLMEQATGEPPRLNFLSMTELDKLIVAAKENALSDLGLTKLLIKLETKNYTREQMLDMFKNRIYFNLTRRRYIQDDFFIYASKTYVTRVFVGLGISPPENLFHIYKTEHDKTTKVCAYRCCR